MIIVKDSSVLIYLAKTTLLETSCKHFRNVLIPDEVFEEVVKTGFDRGFPDASIVAELVKSEKIVVKSAGDKKSYEKLKQLNVQGGEAAAIALYWQEKADLLATDDDNVRKKRHLLDINMVGTLAIILDLYKSKKINKEKVLDAVHKLKDIGWFSNAVLDALLMEVD